MPPAPPDTQPPEAVAMALRGPVALVGLGVEGRETLRFLHRHGRRDLLVFDQAMEKVAQDEALGLSGVTLHRGGDWAAALRGCGTIVRSPGIRPDHPAIAAAVGEGAVLTTATALFLASCPGPVVGVTGTLGKGTTVSLIEAGLRAAGLECRVGGNIGLNPLAFVEELAPDIITVLELSSFQLMGLEGRKPDVAVVLRTTSEHLDWHPDVAEYRQAKAGLLGTGQGGRAQTVVLCADSEGAKEVVGHASVKRQAILRYSRRRPLARGLGWVDGVPHRLDGPKREPLPELAALAMPGAFNGENAAAALLAIDAVLPLHGVVVLPELKARAVRGIAGFPGLPHRLELAGEIAGASGRIRCYNDSYATRPDATLGALESFDAPMALIVGGSEKHADFAALGAAIHGHPSLRRVCLIGQTATRIAQAIAAHGPGGPEQHHAATLEEAFALAHAALHDAAEGVLLFSPACASFDMFPNYKVRGERFKALVAEHG